MVSFSSHLLQILQIVLPGIIIWIGISGFFLRLEIHHSKAFWLKVSIRKPAVILTYIYLILYQIVIFDFGFSLPVFNNTLSFSNILCFNYNVM